MLIADSVGTEGGVRLTTGRPCRWCTERIRHRPYARPRFGTSSTPPSCASILSNRTGRRRAGRLVARRADADGRGEPPRRTVHRGRSACRARSRGYGRWRIRTVTAAAGPPRTNCGATLPVPWPASTGSGVRVG